MSHPTGLTLRPPTGTGLSPRLPTGFTLWHLSGFRLRSFVVPDVQALSTGLALNPLTARPTAAVLVRRPPARWRGSRSPVRFVGCAWKQEFPRATGVSGWVAYPPRSTGTIYINKYRGIHIYMHTHIHQYAHIYIHMQLHLIYIYQSNYVPYTYIIFIVIVRNIVLYDMLWFAMV